MATTPLVVGDRVMIVADPKLLASAQRYVGEVGRVDKIGWMSTKEHPLKIRMDCDAASLWFPESAARGLGTPAPQPPSAVPACAADAECAGVQGVGSGPLGAQPEEPPSHGAAPKAPKRVWLLRHGQGYHNLPAQWLVDRGYLSRGQRRGHLLDPTLTELGQRQARAWRSRVQDLGIEAVLVSPLTRTVQTALLAFAELPVPLELCRHAREVPFAERCNWISPAATLRERLALLPRGDEVENVSGALEAHGAPTTERASLRALLRELRSRVESTVAVVCHGTVIEELTEYFPANCEMLLCHLVEEHGAREPRLECVDARRATDNEPTY